MRSLDELKEKLENLAAKIDKLSASLSINDQFKPTRLQLLFDAIYDAGKLYGEYKAKCRHAGVPVDQDLLERVDRSWDRAREKVFDAFA